MPSTVTKPTSEPSERTPPADDGREHAADQRERQRQERRGPPAASCRRRRGAAGGCRRSDEPRQRRAAARLDSRCGVLAQELGVVLAREAQLAEALARPRARRRRGRGPSTFRPTSRRRDASSRLISFGVGTMRTSATSPRRHVRRRRACRSAGRGCSRRRWRDVRRAPDDRRRRPSRPRRPRRPPRPATSVADAAADVARRSGRSRAAASRSELDLDLRHRTCGSTLQVDDARRRRASRRSTSSAFVAQHARGPGRRCARRSPRSAPVSTSLMRSCR